ncbi:beta-lactamase domain protein [Chloroherpeton thalassium ATCC 35110]|uniref:Beta-lactamase domain protein n=1 Tax=Chloroherpeton thalassium (strain ATCC 35110 / GB-78) TaxID=517418 RepID=B3QXJ4_CHLT3|nr:MBL fold metallo-hydrolase [Chloroherpeton thalassium]ACF14909.1 beta-lactamase domain protein [Chloroherpeton thalassium ATCC 35110]
MQPLEKMKIGNYQVHAILCETFALDGGAMFGTVPKTLWEKKFPADEQNRVTLAARALLISGEGRHILVDAGVGQKWSEKYQEIYQVSESFLEENLAKHDLSLADITDVIITHLHFDHVGGAIKYVDGKSDLAFPNATFYVQEENFDWAMNANPREKASYLKENLLPLQDSGKLKKINGNLELFPGVFTIVSHAHTRGQQLVKVSDGDKTVCFCADLIPTTAHAPLAWVMGYDLFPLDLMAEKKTLLDQAIREDWLLVFQHDLETEAGFPIKTEKGYRIGARVTIG